MKRKWIIIISLISFISLSIWFYNIDLFKLEDDYIPNNHEMELIDYFNEIALKLEYFDNPERITKWRTAMHLFVYSESESYEQMKIIQNTIESMNNISSDGFKINITKDYKRANAFIYVCKKEMLKEIAPKFYKLF